MNLEIDPRKAAAEYGDFKAWARRLEVPYTTVLGWRDADAVPHWRAEMVAQVARKDGKNIFRAARKKKAA